jgi:hypothetical protein
MIKNQDRRLLRFWKTVEQSLQSSSGNYFQPETLHPATFSIKSEDGVKGILKHEKIQSLHFLPFFLRKLRRHTRPQNKGANQETGRNEIQEPGS